MTVHQVSLADAMRLLSARRGDQFVKVFVRGTLQVELYHPLGADHQLPHDRDELYVVVSGTGTDRCAGLSTTLGPNALLFAAAGTEHRFEDFSADLRLWVVFFGPSGVNRWHPVRCSANRSPTRLPER